MNKCQFNYLINAADLHKHQQKQTQLEHLSVANNSLLTSFLSMISRTIHGLPSRSWMQSLMSFGKMRTMHISISVAKELTGLGCQQLKIPSMS